VDGAALERDALPSGAGLEQTQASAWINVDLAEPGGSDARARVAVGLKELPDLEFADCSLAGEAPRTYLRRA
jgi:hypothetical protein